MACIGVVGCGFAGLYAALAARRMGVDVAVVAPDSRIVLRPRLYEADPLHHAIDLIPTFATAEVSFVRGTVASLSDEDGALTMTDRRRLAFDRIVLAAGSRMRRASIPGASHAFSIDSLPDAVAFDARLKELAEEPAPCVVVIGAGFAGIELASELRRRFRTFAGEAQARRLRIVLVDRSEVVGVELGPRPRPAIEGALRSAGIELRLDARVARIDRGGVELDDGERLESSATVMCVGLAAHPLANSVSGKHDPLRRLMVDAHLRAPGTSKVFAAGDVAAAYADDSHLTLLSCQHAITMGKVAGENAARSLLGAELLVYRQEDYITCLDLGDAGALYTQGWDRVPVKSGLEGKAIKQALMTEAIYPPRGTREEVLKASEISDTAQARILRRRAQAARARSTLVES